MEWILVEPWIEWYLQICQFESIYIPLIFTWVLHGNHEIEKRKEDMSMSEKTFTYILEILKSPITLMFKENKYMQVCLLDSFGIKLQCITNYLFDLEILLSAFSYLHLSTNTRKCWVKLSLVHTTWCNTMAPSMFLTNQRGKFPGHWPVTTPSDSLN